MGRALFTTDHSSCVGNVLGAKYNYPMQAVANSTSGRKVIKLTVIADHNLNSALFGSSCNAIIA